MPETPDTNMDDENVDPIAKKTDRQIIDELTGQLSLFPDE